jgi:hypothetical protein
VYRSEDGARTWTLVGMVGTRVDWVAVQPDDCDTAYAATWGTGVQKTVDGGLNWAPANNGLGELFLYTLAIGPDGDILYAGTSSKGVYKSLDAGGSWVPVNSGLPPVVLVDTLVVDPANPQVVYAGTWGYGVFKSLDGGESWSSSSSGLEEKEIYALAVDPGDSKIIYAATFEQGVYRSDDGAGSWTQDALPGQVAYTVMVDEDGLARAGTENAGDGSVVYQRSAAGIWEAMEDQPEGVLAVRNLSTCDSAQDSGQLPGYGRDRPGRNGRGVPGLPTLPQPQRGDQGSASPTCP